MVNADERCDGQWTRVEGSQKSVLDYVLVFEEDSKLVCSMEIDEEKDITPYHIETVEGRKERKYTDHSMITMTMDMSLLNEKSKTYAMILDDCGQAKYRTILEQKKISNLITNDDIRKTYPVWRERVTEIRDGCRKKVKIRKMWKVSRKLTSVKKKITRQLK